MKDYYVQYNIGRSKYVVNFHDGVTTYKDGSKFYDMKIFKNKLSLNAFIAKLESEGYTERWSVGL